MTVHRPHPIEDADKAHGYGLIDPDDPDTVLFDQCDRCAEHAQFPAGLDNSHLARLLAKRYQSKTTANERIALRKIADCEAIAEAIRRLA